MEYGGGRVYEREITCEMNIFCERAGTLRLDDAANKFLLKYGEKPALQNISLDILDEVISLVV